MNEDRLKEKYDETPPKGQDFIHEKVIGKKENADRQKKTLLNAMAGGIVFGISAALCISVLVPFLNDIKGKDTPGETTQEVTESYTQTQPVETTASIIQDEKELEKLVESIVESVQESVQADVRPGLQETMQEALNAVSGGLVTVKGSSQNVDVFEELYDTSVNDSGIIIRKADSVYYVLTGYSVIKDAKALSVALCDGSEAEASLVGFDKDLDIAVVSFAVEGEASGSNSSGGSTGSSGGNSTGGSAGSSDAASKDTVHEGSGDGISVSVISYSGKPELADPVLAVGSPAEVSDSVSVGFVACFDEDLCINDHCMSGIVANMPVSANASSFLIGLDGRLYGMHSSASPKANSGYSEYIGIAKLMIYINRIIDGETTAAFGIKVHNIDTEVKDAYNIPDGVYVESVVKDKGAYYAGIQAGDILTAVGAAPITNIEDYENILLNMAVEKPVSVTVCRSSADGYYEVTVEVNAEICQK